MDFINQGLTRAKISGIQPVRDIKKRILQLKFDVFTEQFMGTFYIEKIY